MFKDFFIKFNCIVKEKIKILMNSLFENFNFIELEKALISLFKERIFHSPVRRHID